jgi:hypothetical protein
MNRGNETEEHKMMKMLLGYLFILLGYFVFYEDGLSDVLAVKTRENRRWLVAGEAERTTTDHLVYNVERSLRRGADRIVILVPDVSATAVRQKLQHQLPRATWTKVGVVTVSQLHRTIARLQTTNAHCHTAS